MQNVDKASNYMHVAKMQGNMQTCSSSPAAGGTSNTNMSTISATAVSDWPTPTVSTNTTS